MGDCGVWGKEHWFTAAGSVNRGSRGRGSFQKTKLGYRILGHLYCHLLCDFSWEDIKYLFTPDNHYWQSEGMSHPESG